MGVVISHKLGQKKNCVKGMLDNTQNIASQIQVEQSELACIKFKIRRLSDFELLIDIGNCETLVFDFQSAKKISTERERDGFSYNYSVLTNDGKVKLDEGYKIDEYPQNEIYYSADFCKTQFSETLVEHKWVADLIRTVASRCIKAEVTDEGGYYHSGILGDAGKAIEENGILIDSISDKLVGSDYTNVVVGNTIIKNRVKK